MNHLYSLARIEKSCSSARLTVKDAMLHSTICSNSFSFPSQCLTTMGDTKDNKVSIKIPRPLYNSLKLLISDSGFNSVNDFIVYVLRDIVANTPSETGNHLSQEEIETIKERLRNLGYLT